MVVQAVTCLPDTQGNNSNKVVIQSSVEEFNDEMVTRVAKNL